MKDPQDQSKQNIFLHMYFGEYLFIKIEIQPATVISTEFSQQKLEDGLRCSFLRLELALVLVAMLDFSELPVLLFGTLTNWTWNSMSLSIPIKFEVNLYSMGRKKRRIDENLVNWFVKSCILSEFRIKSETTNLLYPCDARFRDCETSLDGHWAFFHILLVNQFLFIYLCRRLFDKFLRASDLKLSHTWSTHTYIHMHFAHFCTVSHTSYSQTHTPTQSFFRNVSKCVKSHDSATHVLYILAADSKSVFFQEKHGMTDRAIWKFVKFCAIRNGAT